MSSQIKPARQVPKDSPGRSQSKALSHLRRVLGSRIIAVAALIGRAHQLEQPRQREAARPVLIRLLVEQAAHPQDFLHVGPQRVGGFHVLGRQLHAVEAATVLLGVAHAQARAGSAQVLQRLRLHAFIGQRLLVGRHQPDQVTERPVQALEVAVADGLAHRCKAHILSRHRQSTGLARRPDLDIEQVQRMPQRLRRRVEAARLLGGRQLPLPRRHQLLKRLQLQGEARLERLAEIGRNIRKIIAVLAVPRIGKPGNRAQLFEAAVKLPLRQPFGRGHTWVKGK